MVASGSAIERQLEKAFDAYTAARKISLTHLAGQFTEPGSQDAAPDQKHVNSEKPLLTRTEAFSRLYCRLDNVEDDAAFKSFIEKLIAKKNQATSYEKVILGLVHLFGSWGIPRNYVTAQTYFREAFEADRTNSYAQVLFARMNFVLAAGESARDEETRSQSVSSYYVAMDESKEAEGLAVTLLGLQLEHVPGRSEGLYDSGIGLNFAAASRYLALYYNKQKNVAPRNKLYEAALSHGDMYALVYYFIDHGAAAKDYFVLESAAHGNYLAAFHAAELEKQNPVLAANYYRWSLALRPTWDFSFNEDVCKCFSPMTQGADVAPDILYHYGMAFNEPNYLNDLLKPTPAIFVRLWKNDYCSDRSPVMKKQAVDFLLALNPAGLPAKTNLLLAAATANCSEADIKTKTEEFRKAAGVADLKTIVPPGALASLSAIKHPPKASGDAPPKPPIPKIN